MPIAHARPRFLAAGVVVLVGLGSGVVPADHSTARPVISVVPETAANTARVADAVARFEHAGLELPDLRIEFHADSASCRGHHGLFRTTPGTWSVDICTELDYIVSHELAHAWAEHELTDADRQRYLEARHLRSWSEPDVPYWERGTEDAAFIVQQNLLAIGKEHTWRVRPERIWAYEVLTGLPSPAAPDPDVDESSE